MNDIHAQDSAPQADYSTELRKMADLIERSGLRHTAEMTRGAAAEIERLLGANIVLLVGLHKICEPITAMGDADSVSACQDLHELICLTAREAIDKARSTTVATMAAALPDMWAALEKIAESRDAGRHDGLREECPLHDQYTMWLEARAALAKAEGPASKDSGPSRE